MTDTALAEENALLKARLAETEAALADAVEAQKRLESIVSELRREKFGRRSEKLDPEQFNLPLEDVELAQGVLEAAQEKARRALKGQGAAESGVPKRNRGHLPKHLPRIERVIEPKSTLCPCGCGEMARIGEDVSERLDVVPAQLRVLVTRRPRYACRRCSGAVVQAHAPEHVVPGGLPTEALIAQVMVAKFADHLPLYRQEKIFARAGLAIARSTLAQWVGACGVQLQPLVDALRDCLLQQDVILADETPVQMLAPGTKKTQRAYVWAYAPSPFADLKAVVYDFRPSRAGEHARSFLGDWQGKLVCDDFAGYKASFEQGVTEIGCMAHARRKFFDLHAANQSQLAEQALQYIGQLYEVEREGRELLAAQRRQLRQDKARPIIDGLHSWMLGQRQKVPEGSAIAKALDYSLKRWAALVRYLDDGNLPIDNNWIENQIRPWALGRANWLFAGSLRSGQRGAALMTLIQSARLNGHDPYAYLKDVLMRLPTQKASALAELLPHNWVSAGKV
ncbi:IS66 family transposase [uncultured Roseovarius sp.]|nr:IS66 family transposase [uncultured Roseovarius sp.]